MTETTNYNLKKPDGANNVNISDFNSNSDIIDTIIKGIDNEVVAARKGKDTLKDKMDELDLSSEDWKAFKDNGGNIGGAYLGAFANGIVFGKADVPNSRVQTLNFGDINMLGPSVTKVMDLGSPTNAWKDAYIGNFSKTTNGYSKLPNGLIIQWGEFRIAATLNQINTATIIFPIQFNQKLGVYLTPITNQYDTEKFTHFSITDESNSGLSSFSVKARCTSTGATTWAFKWLAIGF